jgi:Swi5-dependent recombination DNA repair protein 1
MRETRRSLETAQQALSLEEAAEKDVELEAAVQRWRMAARVAAESLFAVAGDRVNKLGGPAGDGWRGLLKGGGGGGGGGGSWGWGEEESRREGGGGGDDDGEDEGLGGEEEEVERVGKEEVEEWGMGLMLRCLGIPVGMLGWDPEGECWRSVEEMEGIKW